MIFGFGKPHFLGIDFGTASIKAIELSVKDGQPVLINYGQVSLEEVVKKKISSKEFLYNNEVASYLRVLIKKMNPKSHSAYVAMPAFSGLIFLVDFPVMEESELQDAVRFEAHKYIPSALEDVALSWEVVNVHSTSSGERMEVLLTAALNKEVSRFEKYVTDAELTMGFLELETFSLARSIVGNELGLCFVIDIGSRATNMLLIHDGVVKLSRNLDVGGKDVTHVIAESFNITLERAEMMKKSGKDFFAAPESNLLFPPFQTIANEVERMLTAYQIKHLGVKCNRIFLSGGCAHFVGLTKYYSNIFKVPVVIGDPWKKVRYNPLLEQKIQELGTSFSVAIGLALCGTDTILNKKTELLKKSKMSFSFKGIFTNKP